MTSPTEYESDPSYIPDIKEYNYINDNNDINIYNKFIIYIIFTSLLLLFVSILWFFGYLKDIIYHIVSLSNFPLIKNNKKIGERKTKYILFIICIKDGIQLILSIIFKIDGII